MKSSIKHHCLDFHHYDLYSKKKDSSRTCVLQTVQIILVRLKFSNRFQIYTGPETEYSADMKEQYDNAGCNTYYINQHPDSSKDLMSCKEQGMCGFLAR